MASRDHDCSEVLKLRKMSRQDALQMSREHLDTSASYNTPLTAMPLYLQAAFTSAQQEQICATCQAEGLTLSHLRFFVKDTWKELGIEDEQTLRFLRDLGDQYWLREIPSVLSAMMSAQQQADFVKYCTDKNRQLTLPGLQFVTSDKLKDAGITCFDTRVKMLDVIFNDLILFRITQSR